jgi:hypothetical protein
MQVNFKVTEIDYKDNSAHPDNCFITISGEDSVAFFEKIVEHPDVMLDAKQDPSQGRLSLTQLFLSEHKRTADTPREAIILNGYVQVDSADIKLDADPQLYPIIQLITQKVNAQSTGVGLTFCLEGNPHEVVGDSEWLPIEFVFE